MLKKVLKDLSKENERLDRQRSESKDFEDSYGVRSKQVDREVCRLDKRKHSKEYE